MTNLFHLAHYSSHGSFEYFLGIDTKVRGILSTGHQCMMFPEPKYVIFSEILLHPTFGTKISGLPYFYSVKLDVIGFGQKAHFWNRETSYIKVLYMISHELDGVVLKFFKITRGRHGARRAHIHAASLFPPFLSLSRFCV